MPTLRDIQRLADINERNKNTRVGRIEFSLYFFLPNNTSSGTNGFFQTLKNLRQSGPVTDRDVKRARVIIRSGSTVS